VPIGPPRGSSKKGDVIVRNWWIGGLLAASMSILGVVPAGAQVRSQPNPSSFPTQPNPVPGGVPWLEGWVGGGMTNNFYGGWLGAVAALNASRNVWADGWVVRGDGLVGHYDYTQPGVPVGNGGAPNIDATFEDASIYLGYRKNVSGLGMLTGYIGVNVQNHDNPDPTAQITGTAVGIKFLGEIYNRLTPTMDFYGMASFSTAFNTWFAMARPGFLVTPVGSGWELWLGPEGQIFGNGYGASFTGSCNTPGGVSGFPGSCRYEEGRLGAFAHIVIPNMPLFGDWIIAGGYRQPFLCSVTTTQTSPCAPNGYYANLTLSFRLFP
jgi:hypothetical protein